MADIAAFLAKIRTAIYGEEVRSSIADAIEAVNEEGTSGGGGGSGAVTVIGGTDYSKLNWVTLYSSSGAYTVKLAKRSGIVYISIDSPAGFTINNVRQFGGVILLPEQIADYFDRTGLQSEYVAHGACYVVRDYMEEVEHVAVLRNAVYTMPMEFTLFPSSGEYGATVTLTRPAELYDIPYEQIGDAAIVHGILSFPDPAPTSGDASWTQVYESTGTHHQLDDGVDYYNNGGTVFIYGHGNGFEFASNQFSVLLDVLLTDRDIWFPVVIDNQYIAAGFMIRQGQNNRTVIGINAANISDGEHMIYFNVSYPTPAEFGAVEAGT